MKMSDNKRSNLMNMKIIVFSACTHGNIVDVATGSKPKLTFNT